MKNYLSIGEVAKLKGITVKTLRHYDKIGLLKPAYVDESSNYRYYAKEQLWLLEFVLMFKQTGASLDEIAEIYKKSNSLELADFAMRQIEKAQITMIGLNDSVFKLRQLIEGIYQSKARSVNGEIYFRHMDAREVLMLPCDTDPFAENTYDMYLKVYSDIREYGLSTIYATGSVVDFDLDTLQLNYKDMYVEAHKTSFSSDARLDVIPAGDYMCINYFYPDQQAQLEKMAEELKRRKITPGLVVESDTFLDIIQYKNPLMELQILISEK